MTSVGIGFVKTPRSSLQKLQNGIRLMTRMVIYHNESFGGKY